MPNFSPLVRLYYYSDATQGFGDGGTFRYVRMTEDCFIATERENMYGRHYTNWNYSQKGADFLMSIANFDSYSIGFEFVNEERYQEEIYRLNVKLQRITEVVSC